MKVKRTDKPVDVLVTKDVLQYSLDGISILVATRGDVISVPSWMASSLEKDGYVSQDIPEQEEQEEDEEVEEQDEEEKDLQLLNETDFAEKDVKEVIKWAKDNLNLKLPSKTSHEEAVKVILETIRERK